MELTSPPIVFPSTTTRHYRRGPRKEEPRIRYILHSGFAPPRTRAPQSASVRVVGRSTRSLDITKCRITSERSVNSSEVTGPSAEAEWINLLTIFGRLHG